MNGVKALAFILALVFVGVGLFCGGGVAVFWNNYEVSNLPPNGFNFTGTQDFEKEVTTLTENAVQMLSKYFSDEMVENGESFKITESKIWTDYEAAVSAEVALYAQDLAELLRTAATPTAEELGTYLDMNYYTVAADGTVTVNESYIRSQIKPQYQTMVDTERNSFYDNYADTRQYLDDVINLQYAVISRDDGSVVSNIDDADVNADFASVLKTTSSWYLAVSEARIIDSNITDSNSGVLHSYLEASIHKSSQENIFDELAGKLDDVLGDGHYDVYLAFGNGSMTDSDVFSALYNSYIDARMSYATVTLVAIACVLLLIPTLAYLISVCGRDGKNLPVHLKWSDKLINSLHLILSGAVIFGVIYFTDFIISALNESSDWFGFNVIQLLIIFSVSGIMVAAVFFEFILSMARQIKNSSFLRNSFSAKIVGTLRKHFGGIHFSAAMKRKGFWLICIYCTVNCLLFFLFGINVSLPVLALIFALLIVVFNVLIFLSVFKSLSAFDDIKTAVSHIQQGDMDYQLDTSNMPYDMEIFAVDIMDMRSGIQVAVDRATRDEKMKTELITNVSHDLKTPLTSIVNYADLLKRDDVPEQDKQKYLTTISEKSIQLKRLIEDLTEVSKLSSGNVELHPVKVNLYELAMQALGESEDELEQANIDMRISESDVRPIVFADGQKTWRIMENLVSNVRKYAMPGTRAYISIGEDKKFGIFSIKNISAQPIDIPVEELPGRFIRGDLSRTGDGSGLGLSIAQSLCELQGGKFELSVDGDLFKATVYLPLTD